MTSGLLPHAPSLGVCYNQPKHKEKVVNMMHEKSLNTKSLDSYWRFSKVEHSTKASRKQIQCAINLKTSQLQQYLFHANMRHHCTTSAQVVLFTQFTGICIAA